jgi:hypothetical protein
LPERFVDRSPNAYEPVPRCCPAHDDWPTLSEHLLVEFPEIDTGIVLREVRTAKTAAASVGLSVAEALSVGELIARHQLMLLAGRTTDGARLEPEHHRRTVHTG